jgi:hypothetical protein
LGQYLTLRHAETRGVFGLAKLEKFRPFRPENFKVDACKKQVLLGKILRLSGKQKAPFVSVSPMGARRIHFASI